MSDDSGVLAGLVEEFTARVRAGELPAIEDYAQRHPELAERIRALFPTLLLLEGMARGDDEVVAVGELVAGSTFGAYTIVREIGRGGMGVVYEAVHRALGRRVALKVLPLSGPQAPQHLERFLREAKTAAGLHHTNIVPVFDVGQVGGVPYYAMQLIAGWGLDALLRQPQRPSSGDDPDATQADGPARVAPTGEAFYRWVAELGVQAAEALDHAHKHGVVHRDVKPSNLLLDGEGRVWVTDFGLARAAGDATLTHTGQIVGTPRYMSPEQAEAATREIDHRTDVYSLGATLYELLTRRPAVEGATPQEILNQLLLREPVAPRRLDAAIPRDLETIVLKAMARRPQDRYATAAELAEDLRRFLDHRVLAARRIGIVGRVVRWAQRNPTVATLLLCVVLTLIGGTAVSTYHAYQAMQEAKRAREAERKAREADERLGRQEAQRHFDQGLAYEARRELVAAVYWFARPLVEGLPLGPDGEEVARQRLGAWLRYGGLPRPLGVFAAGPEILCDLHPDRKTLLGCGREGLQLVSQQGKVQARYATPGRVHFAAFRDGGRRIVAVCSGADAEAESLLLVLDSADGKERVRLPLPEPYWERSLLLTEGPTFVQTTRDRKGLLVARLDAQKPVWQRVPLGSDKPIEGLSGGPDGVLFVVYADHGVESWLLPAPRKEATKRWAGTSDMFRVEPLVGRNCVLTQEWRFGSGEQCACVWATTARDPANAERPVGMVERLGRPSCLALRPDGRHLFAGGSIFTTPPQLSALWAVGIPEILADRCLFRWPDSSLVVEARYLNDGRWLALRDPLRASLWDLSEVVPEPTPGLADQERRAQGAYLLPDARRAVLLHHSEREPGADSRLELCDSNGKVVQVFPLLDERHRGWFATRNGRFVVGFRNDTSRVVVHATETGQVVADLMLPAVGRAALALSEDGATFLRLVKEAKIIEVIDPTTGRVQTTLPLPRQDEAPLATGFDAVFSPDGSIVASLFDGRVQAWDRSTWKVMWSRVVPEAEGLVVDSTGRGLLVVEEGGVRVWDVATGQPRTPLWPGTDGYWAASWDATARRVALVRSGDVVVWDAVEGRPLTPVLACPAPHYREVRTARLSADGRTLTTIDGDAIRRTWDLSPDDTPAEELPGQLERATGYRMDAAGRVALATSRPNR